MSGVFHRIQPNFPWEFFQNFYRSSFSNFFRSSSVIFFLRFFFRKFFRRIFLKVPPAILLEKHLKLRGIFRRFFLTFFQNLEVSPRILAEIPPWSVPENLLKNLPRILPRSVPENHPEFSLETLETKFRSEFSENNRMVSEKSWNLSENFFWLVPLEVVPAVFGDIF